MKLFPDKNISNEIMSIALPVVGGLATQMLLSLIDTAMVGRLENSKVALAALGLAFLASWAITSLFSSLSTGTHVLIARRQGEGNMRGVSEALNNSLLLSILLGITFAIIGYFFSFEIMDFFSKDNAVADEGAGYMAFRFLGLPFFLMIVSYRGFFYGIGHSKVILHSAIVVMVMHIFINFLLIFGNLGFPKMGLAGAGVSSFISLVVGWLVLVFVTFMKEYRMTYSYYKHIYLSKETIRQILKISIPVSLQNVLILLGFLIFVAVTGIIGTAEQAASQVVISTLFISFIPCFGLGAAAQTLVGQSLGRGNPLRAQIYGFQTAQIGTYFTLVIGFIFIFFPESVLSVFTTNAEVVKLALPLLQIAGLSQMFYGGGIILANSLQAAGATVFVMWVEVFTHWVLFLPLTYLFGVILHGGIIGAWWALPLYVIMFLALNYFKFRSKTWMKIKI